MRIQTQALLIIFGIVSFALPTSAAAPLHVRFAPASLCADEPALAAHLRARGLETAPPRHREAEANAEAYDVEIQVEKPAAEYEAKMVLVAPGEPPATRVVFAATCDEVWSTFAFALSLAFAQLPDAPARPPPPPRAASVSRRPAVAFGASSKLLWGVSPDPTLAFGVFAEIGARESDTRIVSPRVRAGAFVLLPPTFEQAGVSTRYALQSAEIELCPLRFFSLISLRPCARLEIGRLEAVAFGGEGTRREGALWAAVELALLARWQPLRPIFVELEAAAGPALARPAFFYRNIGLSSVPAIVGHLGLSAGVHFP